MRTISNVFKKQLVKRFSGNSYIGNFGKIVSKNSSFYDQMAVKEMDLNRTQPIILDQDSRE